MTTVGPVPPPLPPAPTNTATTGTPNAVGSGATPNPSAPTITANAVQALTAIIVNLPNTLRTKPAGSPVTGTLTAQDSNGNALVKTADGVVVLRGPVNLPLGSALTLYLPEEPDSAVVRLVLQRPPDEGAVTVAARGATGGVPGGVPGRGAVLPGVVAGAGAPTAAPATPLAPGSTVLATLVQPTQPDGAHPAQARYAQAPIGASFDARVLTIADPQIQPLPGPALGINAQGHLVANATVIGRTAAGQVVVNAGFGLLRIDAAGEIPAGMALRLELLGRPAATTATTPALPALPDDIALAARLPGDAGTLAHDWETLRRTFEALLQTNPAAAQQALGRAIAVPGERFAAGLLFLVAAMRGGDVAGLLGETAVRSLERAGRGALLRRLGDELTVLNRLATEPSSEWRAFFLPVLPPDGPVTPVRLFFRQPKRKPNAPEQATRFVVETEMTRLGPIQIDGLTKGQRLDVILRTQEALPETARTEIERLFQSAAVDGQFSGSIAFQALARFPIDPLDEIGHPVHGVVA